MSLSSHAWIFLGAGLLVALVAVPLILKKVPMNRWYGVRFPQSYRSDRLWYEINRHGGGYLLGTSLAWMTYGVCGLVEPGIWNENAPRYAFFGMVVMVVSTVAGTIASYLKARQLASSAIE
ncbi:SdpI family protein [Haloferula sargassicola]|uniref:SdpI family protein n=1 Tax=Haloferula sargassicola TaxID=490096 RepID=A0ABP9UMD5_9BACT